MNANEIETLEQEIKAGREASEACTALAQDLASSAYHVAVDQQALYSSLSESLDVHLENALDTAVENSIDCDAVNAWFWRFVDGGVK